MGNETSLTKFYYAAKEKICSALDNELYSTPRSRRESARDRNLPAAIYLLLVNEQGSRNGYGELPPDWHT